MKIHPLLFCLLFLLVIACKKDNNYSADDIKLTAKRGDTDINQVTLSWNVPDYEGAPFYYLYRSVDSLLPDTYRPSHQYLHTTSIFSSFSQNINSYTDLSFKPESDQYYKLYIEVDDKIISSNTVKIPTFQKTIDVGTFWAAEIIPETSFLLIVTTEGKTVTYDFKENKILHEIGLDLHYPNIRIGDAGNGLEAFVFSENGNKLFVLDVNNLSIRSEQSFDFDIQDVAPSTKGFLFISERSSWNDINYLLSINRSDWAKIDTFIHQNDPRALKIIQPNDNSIYAFSRYQIQSLQFDDDGFFTTFQTQELPYTSYLSADVAVSPSGNHLNFLNEILVYRNDLEFVRHIPGESYCLAFESDEILYTCNNVDNRPSIYRADIHQENLTPIFSSVFAKEIFITDDKIIALYRTAMENIPKTGIILLDK